MKTIIDKIAIGICGILIVSLLMILFTGCSSINPATRYAKKIAEPVEHPAWRKSQKPSKKDWRIQVAENQVKAYELKKKRETEEEEIKKKVESIKSQIGNE